MKKIISAVLIISILLSLLPINFIVYAATDDYKDIKWGETYGSQYELYEKPTAGFSLSSGGQTVVADSGGELNIKLGDTISISNLSKASRTNSLNGYDWQVYGNTSVGGVTVALGVLSSLPSSITLKYTGTYDFYLCVRDNQPNMPSDGGTTWQNWSDNGSHRSYGTSSTGVKMWWYFVHVRVNVTSDKPIAALGFSDTDEMVKHIYLGESFTLVDKSYATAPGASIIGWNVRIGNNPPTYTTNPGSFFKTYTLQKIGIFTYEVPDVYDIFSSRSENTSIPATVLVSQRPQPGQGKVIYEHYKDSVSPSNLLGTNEVGISNPYVVVLPESYGDGLKFSSATYSGEAVTTGGSCKNGDSITIANATKDLIIQAIYKAGATGPSNSPPYAVIEIRAESLVGREPDNPDEVMAGDRVTLDGRKSYDIDGEVVAWEWYRITDGDFTLIGTGKTISTYFMNVGYEEILLVVTDDWGDTGEDYRTIKVNPPIPKAVIKYSGIPKENRKEVLDATDSWSPVKYPINSWIWSIEPTNITIKGTSVNFTTEEKQNLAQNIKYHLSLTGEQKDVLFKMDKAFKDKYRALHGLKQDESIKINYKVTLTVINTYGRSNTATSTLAISEDLPPIADFVLPHLPGKSILRDPNPISDTNEDSYATFNITDISQSIDGDMIRTICFVAYDSDNDGNFDDEVCYYCADGTTWLPADMAYEDIWSSFNVYDLAVKNPLDDNKYEYKTKDVGYYRFEIIVIEYIPEHETIKEFILKEDYRTGNTL